VTQRGWTLPNQYHARNGVCKADKQFSFRGVPFCVLLDTEGKVAFMGHPASRKFEDDFQTLLDGKKLTGQGTGPEPEAEGGDGGSTSVDAGEAIKNFTTEVEKVKSGLDAETTKKFARAFLVLVDESKFDGATGKVKPAFTHY